MSNTSVVTETKLDEINIVANTDVQTFVDLRSDTVTHPTRAMREAMLTCAVGDDVMGDDPTVNELECATAELLNKEAALFVPSGTMSNLIAVMVHCQTRGSEVILGDQSHISLYEQGGISTIGGVHPRTVKNAEDGTLPLEEIERLIRTENVHFPVTRLVCLENTHNACGGRVLSMEYVEKVAALCRKHNLALHMDGARIWNAAQVLKLPVAKLVEAVDTVSVCLSKGLGAPVGSLLVGPKAFIAAARRIRKVLGGGMRQAGVLAACGLVALRDMRERVTEDHIRARRIADALAVHKSVKLNPDTVDSNIVFFELDPAHTTLTASSLVSKLNEGHKVLIMALGPMRCRIVTHYMIDDAKVDTAIRALLETLDAHAK